MPIRINLLAEEHALEEERRRDPVKRAFLGAACLVSLVLVWSVWLQARILSGRSALSGLQAQWQSMEKEYQQAVDQQRKVIEAEKKLAALQSLTTNRFLWGTALNALQVSMVDIDDIHVVHLKCAQAYVVSEEVKSTKRNGVDVPGKPPRATETISMLIDAVDASTQPGSAVNKFKQAIARVPYFQESLKKTNGVLLTSLSAPQLAPNTQEPFVTFSVQCYFPEKVR